MCTFLSSIFLTSCFWILEKDCFDFQGVPALQLKLLILINQNILHLLNVLNMYDEVSVLKCWGLTSILVHSFSYALSLPKAQAVAQETLAVWCSLASRLGVWALKAELEDLCFAVLQVCHHNFLNCDIANTCKKYWIKT